jgi:hypothetical protein
MGDKVKGWHKKGPRSNSMVAKDAIGRFKGGPHKPRNEKRANNKSWKREAYQD